MSIFIRMACCCNGGGGDDDVTYCASTTCPRIVGVEVQIAGVVAATAAEIDDFTNGSVGGYIAQVPSGTFTASPTSPGALTFLGSTNGVFVMTYNDAAGEDFEPIEIPMTLAVGVTCPTGGSPGIIYVAIDATGGGESFDVFYDEITFTSFDCALLHAFTNDQTSASDGICYGGTADTIAQA